MIGSYSQWYVHASRGDVKRATWVCGPERVLVEEVVDKTRELLAASDMDYVTLEGGTDPDREIWAAAGQYPLIPGSNRLILVRSAEKIKNWQKLEEWLEASTSRLLPNIYLLLVSGEDDYYVDAKTAKKISPEAPGKVMKPHVEKIKDKGRLVKCTRPNSTDLIAWVQRHANLDEHMANHLLMRVGGNLLQARNVCRKLSIFGSKQFGPGVIDSLCNESPVDTFADALLNGKKKQAMQSLERMDTNTYSGVIGLLDSRLDLLSLIHRGLRQNKTVREIVAAYNISEFLTRMYIGIAKNYDPGRIERCRYALATTDDILHGSERDGVMLRGSATDKPFDGLMELLIARW